MTELLDRRRPGWSLEGAFFRDEEIYRLDVERVWRRGWLFAGHACEIARPGDYFLVEVDADSVIVIRAEWPRTVRASVRRQAPIEPSAWLVTEPRLELRRAGGGHSERDRFGGGMGTTTDENFFDAHGRHRR